VGRRSGNDTISILPGASISLTGTQSATAVDAGSGNDSVLNDGSVSVTLTPPAATDKSASCAPQGVGIAGGGGNDTVSNRGTIAVQTASGGSQAPQCNPSGSDDKHGGDKDDDDRNGGRPAKPSAASIGITGDSGNDQISNSGSIAVTASSASSSPQATAKGIYGANRDDILPNLPP